MNACFHDRIPVIAGRSLDDLRRHRAFARPRFELVYPTTVLVDGNYWRVPIGFQTDFASVPRLLLWLFPADGPWRAPAVVHDCCYSGALELCGAAEDRRGSDAAMQLIGYDRAWADSLFFELMRDVNVRWYGRYPLWLAVWLFGGLYWRKEA